MLASTKYSRQQNSCVDKTLVSTKFSHQQNAQVRKYLLTVWLSRVHSRGLLPDLADDLLCFPEGVDPSTCRQVEGGTARSPPPPATHTPFQQSETSAVDLCDSLYFGDNEYID